MPIAGHRYETGHGTISRIAWRFQRLLPTVLLPVCLAACRLSQLEALPLTVSVEASRTVAAPQDSITFVIRAAGGALIGITADYGDGTSDLFATGGARTASSTFRHAYTARGVYTVAATVTDVSAGQKSATIEIRVN